MKVQLAQPTWMDRIKNFLVSGSVPTDPSQARKLRCQSAHYLMQEDKLFKRGYSLPLLRCLDPEVASSSPAHLQSNGQIEAVNKIIKRGLKTRLESLKDRWAEELPEVLWSYRTIPRPSTGETPYDLALGSEAVIPVEIGMLTPRVENFNEQTNSEALLVNLDLLAEKRSHSQLRLAEYHNRMAWYYNARVKVRMFKPGDLVLKKVMQHVEALQPNWEGPYRVLEILRPRAYLSFHLNGRQLPHPWNAEHLRVYYQ
ncbi:uncharacterized protein LOC111023203 [Momordica charantia]|uniref:Uncharacterized protein LOC111023203 n=1 Tax=Momordica charantia TaxID=3673 RepID=A0A6J1DUF4_MOMCH|nr:uncharacterized protein LOC111023203 [Momordica charantia]